MKDIRIRIDEPKLLSEDIAESIKAAIIKGKFKPGEKISEGDLAQSMGISRTPLREAFRKLENQGFIQIIPRKGAMVTEVSATEAQDLYEIKSTLEGLAARLAAQRMTEKDLERLERINEELKGLIEHEDLEAFYRTHTRFHESFVKACGNSRLAVMISNLNDHFKRFGIVSLTLPGQYEQAIRQHEQIIAAFRRKDADAAEHAVTTNVMTGGLVLIEHLKMMRAEGAE